MVEYYSRFVPRHAAKAEPLRKFLRKDISFIEDTEAERSFKIIKTLLSSARVLKMLDSSLPLIVSTDSSAFGLGAVLQQRNEKKVQRVAFASRRLAAAERKYFVREREALTWLSAWERWHNYLGGRRFTLKTDHRSFVNLLVTRGTGHRPLQSLRQFQSVLCSKQPPRVDLRTPA